MIGIAVVVSSPGGPELSCRSCRTTKTNFEGTKSGAWCKSLRDLAAITVKCVVPVRVYRRQFDFLVC